MAQTVTIKERNFTYEMLHPFLMKAERRPNKPQLAADDDFLLQILWFKFEDTWTMTISEVGPVRRYVNRAVNSQEQKEYDEREGFMAPPEMSSTMKEWSERYQAERTLDTQNQLEHYKHDMDLARLLQEAVHEMRLTTEDYETVVFSQNLLILNPQFINAVLFRRREKGNRSAFSPDAFRTFEHLLPSYIWSDAEKYHRYVHKDWEENYYENTKKRHEFLVSFSEDSGITFNNLMPVLRNPEEGLGSKGDYSIR